MPMLSPQLATRAGPSQGPWEIFGRRETEGTTPPGQGSEEDILLPLNKSRTASMGGIATGNFRPFESSRPAASLFIHNLPRDMTQRELHLMFTFANDYMSSELIREPGRISANVKFRTMGGATAAQAILEHRPDIFGEASSWLKCEIRPTTSSGVSTPTTSQPASNIKSRFLFMNDDPATPTESIAASSSASSSSAFIPSSPLYTSSASRLFDPLPLPRRPSNGTAFDCDKRPGPPPRRASVPTRPIGEVSVQTQHLQQQQQQPQPQSASHVQQQQSQPHSQSQSSHGQPHSQQMSQSLQQQQPGSHASSSGQQATEYGDPTKVVVPFGPGTSKAKAVSIMQNGGRVLPPANPADQNPPCNTLYVGNLPPDTQEEELKELFSVRPGYKRLCFRTKANGPMCFVEFEDEVFAGKALEDLYGFGLSNSVKGGIRLSFSKNPLGVRSRQPQQKFFN